MNEGPSLRDVFKDIDTVLLDFDGPICAVFSGIVDFAVASQIREVLTAAGVSLPEAVAQANDPLAVLGFAATASHETLVAVEDRLREAELAAVKVATPTPGAHEFMKAVYEAGKRLAIVSNNGSPAIHGYLDQHELSHLVEAVAGRAYAQPQLMKPHPHSVRMVLGELGVSAETAVLIGDSVTDIEASLASGVKSIGFANKPGKAKLLAEAGATAVALMSQGMAALTDAITGVTEGGLNSGMGAFCDD